MENNDLIFVIFMAINIAIVFLLIVPFIILNIYFIVVLLVISLPFKNYPLKYFIGIAYGSLGNIW